MTDTGAEFGLGMSISPSWSTDDEVDRITEVARLAARTGASMFLMGDKPIGDAGTRANDVLVGWLARDFVGVPRVGSLFLVRERPLDSLLVTARTLRDLIRRGGSIPVIGVMQGRLPHDATVPGPDVDDAAAAVRADPNCSDVELWVGAERGRALDRAGRVGDGWLANAHYDHRELVEQLDRFRKSASADARAAVRRDFVCAPVSDSAHAAARELLAEGYRGGKFDEATLIAGTPAECLERLAEDAALGFDDILVRPALSGQAATDQFHLLFEEWSRR